MPLNFFACTRGQISETMTSNLCFNQLKQFQWGKRLQKCWLDPPRGMGVREGGGPAGLAAGSSWYLKKYKKRTNLAGLGFASQILKMKNTPKTWKISYSDIYLGIF